MSQEAPSQDENLRLADLRFRARHGDADAGIELKRNLIDRKALPFLRESALILDWPKDSKLEAVLEKEIAKELAEIDARISDQEENAGETEVRDAKLARAEFFGRILDKKRAEDAYEETFNATVGVGQKIDIVFALIRIGFTDVDYSLAGKYISRAKDLIEKGGDWERRNRLKVYEAVYMSSRRDIKGAAKLFLDSLATFSATELFDYKTFVIYTVITTIVSVDRPTLRDKVANAPEILTVILEEPLLNTFLNALVDCDYKSYTRALPDVLDLMRADRFLSIHTNYIGRELRVVAYAQFLASYQSVTLSAMCRNFGFSKEFLDRELARFIAAGRLNCKIDMVGGIVETTRPDAKNALYHRTIKQGDLLLNRVQKLSRVIDI